MNRILIPALVGAICIAVGISAAQGKPNLQLKESCHSALDLPRFSVKQFKKQREQLAVLVLDTRSGDEFLKGFIPGSINIGFKGPFETFLEQVIPNKEQKLLLVVEPPDYKAVADRLAQLGYTGAIGLLDGGIDRWKDQEPIDSVPNLTAQKFRKRSDQGHIVDVRTTKEFEKGHIDNAMNIPLVDFATFGSTLKKGDAPMYVHCQSGYRSAIAASILRIKGFKNVCNIQGGYKALKDEIKEN